MRSVLSVFFAIIFLCKINAQLTVGTLLNTPQSQDGYTLFSPLSGFNTYLIDNCGRQVNTWNCNYPAGLAAYLHSDGSLYRSGRILNNKMTMGGLGGIIERYSWEGDLLWSYRCSGDDSTSHHDFEILPNGNILLLVAFSKPIAEAISIGRDSTGDPNDVLFFESILEIEPIGTDSARIVWRWNSKDHLVQSRDSSKTNYAIIADHPERLNINYLGSSIGRDWLHANSIDYNPALDQIVIGLRNLSEFWVLDHSTSITEAAGNSGGRYGKGGDILYRWGNPATYERGGSNDQKLYEQHDVSWIPDMLPGAGSFLVFNNGEVLNYSSVAELSAPIDSFGFYTQPGAGTAFGPQQPYRVFRDDSNPLFFSGRLSSAQRQPNGNTLICSGNSGYFLEMDSIGNHVWSYRNPITGTGIISQGTLINYGVNSVFAVSRYLTDYSGLAGKNLIPGDPLELNFDISQCQIYNGVKNSDNQLNTVHVYPNPVLDIVNIENFTPIESVEIYNSIGQIIEVFYSQKTNIKQINISNYSSGCYFIRINNHKKLQCFIKNNL